MTCPHGCHSLHPCAECAHDEAIEEAADIARNFYPTEEQTADWDVCGDDSKINALCRWIAEAIEKEMGK